MSSSFTLLYSTTNLSHSRVLRRICLKLAQGLISQKGLVKDQFRNLKRGNPPKEGQAMSSGAGSRGGGGSSTVTLARYQPTVSNTWLYCNVILTLIYVNALLQSFLHLYNQLYRPYISCSRQQTIGRGRGKGNQRPRRTANIYRSHYNGDLELLEFVVQCTAPLEMTVDRRT